MAHEPENIRALVELVRQDPEPFPCLIIEEEQCFSLRESQVIQEHFAWAGLPAPAAYHLSRLEAGGNHGVWRRPQRRQDAGLGWRRRGHGQRLSLIHI